MGADSSYDIIIILCPCKKFLLAICIIVTSVGSVLTLVHKAYHSDLALKQKVIVHTQKSTETKAEHKLDNIEANVWY